jgi:hypothetical protein
MNFACPCDSSGSVRPMVRRNLPFHPLLIVLTCLPIHASRKASRESRAFVYASRSTARESAFDPVLTKSGMCSLRTCITLSNSLELETGRSLTFAVFTRPRKLTGLATTFADSPARCRARWTVVAPEGCALWDLSCADPRPDVALLARIPLLLLESWVRRSVSIQQLRLHGESLLQGTRRQISNYLSDL